MIAGLLEHPEGISNVLREPVAPLDNSPAAARVPSTQRAAALPDPVVRAHLADAPDLEHAPDSALSAPADLAARDRVRAELPPLARHRARSERHRIAHDVADSSIQRRRKAQ